MNLWQYTIFETQKSRIAGLIFIAAASAAAFKVSYAFVRYCRVEREIVHVEPGQTRTSVVALLGMPNYHAGACGELTGSYKNCVLEYDYSHPLAPFVPEYYEVEFTADDRVLNVAKLDSP